MGGQSVFGDHLYTVHLTQGDLAFTYPSFAALLFAPMALVSFTSAQVFWGLANVAALLALLFLTIRALRPGLANQATLRWAMIGLAPALWLQPVRLTFNLGQINVFVVLLVVADLTWPDRIGRATLPRGVLIGVASAIKLTPLIFVPWLFLTGRARAGWTALAAFLGCNVLVAMVAPRATWQYWTKYGSQVARIGNANITSDQNLRAFLSRLHHGAVPGGIVVLASLCIGIAGMALAVVAARGSSRFLGMLVCAITGLLVSPITWSHHLIWVIPTIAWLVLGKDRPKWGTLWAALTALLFWIAPIWRIPHGMNLELAESPVHLMWGNSYFFAMIAFLIGIGLMLVVRSRSTVDAPIPEPVTKSPTVPL